MDAVSEPNGVCVCVWRVMQRSETFVVLAGGLQAAWSDWSFGGLEVQALRVCVSMLHSLDSLRPFDGM